MMPWLLSSLGLVILLLAGDALVRGAVNLSLRVGEGDRIKAACQTYPQRAHPPDERAGLWRGL